MLTWLIGRMKEKSVAEFNLIMDKVLMKYDGMSKNIGVKSIVSNSLKCGTLLDSQGCEGIVVVSTLAESK